MCLEGERGLVFFNSSDDYRTEAGDVLLVNSGQVQESEMSFIMSVQTVCA